MDDASVDRRVALLHNQAAVLYYHEVVKPKEYKIYQFGTNGRNKQMKRKTIHVVAALIRENNRIYATQRGYGEFKDGWEFPGGKIEDGESPQNALKREIEEELKVEIEVGDYYRSIEYDYPEFHLSMKCYWCCFVAGTPVLLEHEAARWLKADELFSVNWLPADRTILNDLKKELSE